MKLSDIVKKKFLPPLLSSGKFGIEKILQRFSSFIIVRGTKYSATSSDSFDSSPHEEKEMFSTAEEARERCWKHFENNRRYYFPNETL